MQIYPYCGCGLSPLVVYKQAETLQSDGFFKQFVFQPIKSRKTSSIVVDIQRVKLSTNQKPIGLRVRNSPIFAQFQSLKANELDLYPNQGGTISTKLCTFSTLSQKVLNDPMTAIQISLTDPKLTKLKSYLHINTFISATYKCADSIISVRQ